MKKTYTLTIVMIALAAMAFHSNTSDTDAVPNTNENEFEAYKPIVVLELFTSQGCSSCPSADMLLQKVKNEYQKEVYALSYHVDYWNYIGWKDPFSKSSYAQKQREYNIKFRNNSNYTPQLVVNGKEHFVGSSTTKMYRKIQDYKERKTGNEISLTNISVLDHNASFKYDLKGNLEDKNIRVLLVIDERTTEVKRGENRNRTLKNSNVVVAEKTLSAKAAGDISIEIPELVKEKDRLNLIVLVENEDFDITAAGKGPIMRE